MESANSESKWSLDIIDSIPLVTFTELNHRISNSGSCCSFSSILLLKSCMFFSLGFCKFIVSNFHSFLLFVHSLFLSWFSDSWGIGLKEFFWFGRECSKRASNCLIRIEIKCSSTNLSQVFNELRSVVFISGINHVLCGRLNVE